MLVKFIQFSEIKQCSRLGSGCGTVGQWFCHCWSVTVALLGSGCGTLGEGLLHCWAVAVALLVKRMFQFLVTAYLQVAYKPVYGQHCYCKKSFEIILIYLWPVRDLN